MLATRAARFGPAEPRPEQKPQNESRAPGQSAEDLEFAIIDGVRWRLLNSRHHPRREGRSLEPAGAHRPAQQTPKVAEQMDDGSRREVVALLEVEPIDADLVAGHVLERFVFVEEQGEIP